MEQKAFAAPFCPGDRYRCPVMHPGMAFSEDGHEAGDSVPLDFMQAAWRHPAEMDCHPFEEATPATFLGLPADPFPEEGQGRALKKRKGFGGNVMDSSHLLAQLKQPSHDLPTAFACDFEGGQNVIDFLEDETGAESKKDGFSRMTEFINMVASRGNALFFDHETGNFHVLDGAQFQKEYCALRSTRGKKNQGARDRPFAQMYRAYVMVRGDKWASKGTVFRAKDPKHAPQIESRTESLSPSHEDFERKAEPPSCSGSPHSHRTFASDTFSHTTPVQAHEVVMQIRDTNGEQVDLSLQHFLDVTGAGALYMAALGRGRGGEKGGGGGLRADVEHMMGGVPGDCNPTSRDDQAYFFKRK
eukprot:1171498-Rhodomonas_salina.2